MYMIELFIYLLNHLLAEDLHMVCDRYCDVFCGTNTAFIKKVQN